MTSSHEQHIRTIGTCPDCGKKRFSSRQDAKRAARRLFPGTCLRPYQCGQFWHIGRTSRWRRRGDTPGRPPASGGVQK